MNSKSYLSQSDIDSVKNEISPFGPIGEIVDVRTYRRFNKKDHSRESLTERDLRVINYNLSLVDGLVSYTELEAEALLMLKKFSRLEVGPSSRTKWVGGTQSVIDNAVGNFNCSALAINRLSAFADLFSILMLGCGGGYRVFERDINQLPKIANKSLKVTFLDYTPLPKNLREESTTAIKRDDKLFITAGDSREGWVECLMLYLNEMFDSNSKVSNIIFDFDSIRPLGTRIAGFGGTASGPEALQGIINNAHLIIQQSPEDRLRSIDCMDLCCTIAKGVVAGSSRRSALICLFDEGDELCANAKKGLYTNTELFHKQYRAQSNNTECIGSIYYKELLNWLAFNPTVSEEEIYSYIEQFKPTKEKLAQRMESIKTEGEPGLNNYLAMVVRRYVAARTWRPDQNPFDYCDVATNPCHEILLSTGFPTATIEAGKSGSFCNLTTLNLPLFVKVDKDGKAYLDYKELELCQRLSVRIGLRQTCVSIPMEGWSETQLEERLLGVSATGWQDMFDLLGYSNLGAEASNIRKLLRAWANDEATTYAKHLGIKRPLLTTTVKPEGCLVLSSYRTFNEGILRIDEIDASIITKEGFIQSPIKLSTTVTNSNVSKLYNNGLSELYKITLNNGRELISTVKHPFSVNGEWVKAHLIKVGDVLDFNLGTYNKTSEASLVGLQHLTGLKDITLPEVMSNNLAWLIAAIYTNGSTSKRGSIEFCSGYLSVCSKYKSILKTIFNLDVKVVKDKEKNMYSVDINSTDLYDFLDVNACLKSKQFDRVPLVIRKSSRESVLSFIAGYLDTDGCFKNKGCSITSTKIDFAKSLQETAEAVGLSFSFYKTTRVTTKGECTYVDLQLSRGFSLNSSIEFINSFAIKAQDKPIISTSQIHKHPYKVKSVELLDELDYTYDVVVDNTHWYYTGGIKSHNTASQVYGCSWGLHNNWSPYYIRRVRITSRDALAQVLLQQGYPCYPEVYDLDKVEAFYDSKDISFSSLDPWQKLDIFDKLSTDIKKEVLRQCSTIVFEFPVKSSAKRTQVQVSALEQLEGVKLFTNEYTDHMPSSTISVKSDEWGIVTNWLYENWTKGFITASFLSFYDSKYPLLPYEEIAEEEYERRFALIPEYCKQKVEGSRGYFKVDMDLLSIKERELEDPDDIVLDSECSQGSCPVR